MTRHTYRIIRKRESQNGVHVYPPYSKVVKAKARCYPPGIKITETRAEVPLQSLLDHLSSRILDVQSDVIVTLPENQVNNLQLIIKYGFDGSSGQSQYKQKFNDKDVSDASILLSSLVPLRLISGNDKNLLIWRNPKPSSPRFCSPIKLEYIREDKSSTLKEQKYIEDQIAELNPYETELKGKKITVSFELICTMIDGKVRNNLTNTTSNMRCYLCKAISTQFNKLDQVLSLPVEKNNLRFGIATLLRGYTSWNTFYD